MTLGGEWACMRYEMKPILLGKNTSKIANDTSAEHGNRSNNKNASDARFMLEEASEELDYIEDDDQVTSSVTNAWAQAKKGKRKASDAETQNRMSNYITREL
ncbi:unnamed protein product [Absidia cylindrospora]